MIVKRITLLAFALLLAGCGKPVDPHPIGSLRVVSIAPNVTEILYALGLSNEVVGVSRYSTYPPEVAQKPSVGGTYDPNWEMIVSLQPDLVIGLNSQTEIAAQLKQLGIDFLGVPHERVTEVMNSILLIGGACGKTDEAQRLFQTLEATALRHRNASNGWKPKVLVCVGHDEQLTRMYVAARNTFYDDLITLAGGTNVCQQTAIKYPEISPEGLRALQPDLVIDIFPTLGKKLPASQSLGEGGSLHPDYFPKLWNPYKAVVFTNSYAFIPGPRFGLLLDDLTKAIHMKNESE